MTEELHHERDATISFEQTNSMDHGRCSDRACCWLQCVRLASSYVLDSSYVLEGSYVLDSSNGSLDGSNFCASNIGAPGPGRRRCCRRWGIQRSVRTGRRGSSWHSRH